MTRVSSRAIRWVFPGLATPRLYDRVVEMLRGRHYSRRTALSELSGAPRLVCTLLYGSGLRLLEALQLRVKDLDFGRGEITFGTARAVKTG